MKPKLKQLNNLFKNWLFLIKQRLKCSIVKKEKRKFLIGTQYSYSHMNSQIVKSIHHRWIWILFLLVPNKIVDWLTMFLGAVAWFFYWLIKKFGPVLFVST